MHEKKVSCAWAPIINRIQSDIESGGVHEIHIQCFHGSSLIVNANSFFRLCLSITVGARTESLNTFGLSLVDWATIRAKAVSLDAYRHKGTSFDEFFLNANDNSIHKLAALVLGENDLNEFQEKLLNKNNSAKSKKDIKSI